MRKKLTIYRPYISYFAERHFSPRMENSRRVFKRYTQIWIGRSKAEYSFGTFHTRAYNARDAFRETFHNVFFNISSLFSLWPSIWISPNSKTECYCFLWPELFSLGSRARERFSPPVFPQFSPIFPRIFPSVIFLYFLQARALFFVLFLWNRSAYLSLRAIEAAIR